MKKGYISILGAFVLILLMSLATVITVRCAELSIGIYIACLFMH